MRSAVKPQIHMFRQTHPNKFCVLCDTSSSSIEVDHYPETFASIKHSFLNSSSSSSNLSFDKLSFLSTSLLTLTCESTTKLPRGRRTSDVRVGVKVNLGERPTKFIWNGKYYIFSNSDYQFSQVWQQYHKDRAGYRYLCAKCNVKKLC